MRFGSCPVECPSGRSSDRDQIHQTPLVRSASLGATTLRRCGESLAGAWTLTRIEPATFSLASWAYIANKEHSGFSYFILAIEYTANPKTTAADFLTVSKRCSPGIIQSRCSLRRIGESPWGFPHTQSP